MKFNPFEWTEVKPNAKIEQVRGRLLLQCSQAAPLYAEAEGVEALVGFGTSFDVEVSEGVTFRLDSGPTTRVFYYTRRNPVIESKGEVYTNIDRLPHESGTLLEVRRALRELEIARRQSVRQIRSEAERLRAERESLIEAVETSPAPAPAPENKEGSA